MFYLCFTCSSNEAATQFLYQPSPRAAQEVSREAPAQAWTSRGGGEYCVQLAALGARGKDGFLLVTNAVYGLEHET